MTFVSTASLGSEDLARIAASPDLLCGLGLELGSSAGPDMVDRLLELVSRDKGPGAMMHHYFPPPADPFVINIASTDAGILGRSLDHCRGCLALCERMGVPLYSVHAGMALDPAPGDLGRPLTDYPTASMERAEAVFMDSVAMLAREAEALGVGLAVENNVLAAFNAPDGVNRMCLLASDGDVMRFLERAPDSVGLLLDLGHLKVSAATLGFDAAALCRAVAGRTVVLHLHDNDGARDQHLPFGADVWFAPLLPLFSHAAMVVETIRQPLDSILEMAALAEAAVKGTTR